MDAVRTRSLSHLLLSLALVAVLGCGDEGAPPTAPGPERGPTLANAADQALSFQSISAGSFHSCGIAADSRAYCWGGNGTRPVAVPGGLHFIQVSAGGDHNCGVTPDNLAYCWGSNLFGQLGDGTTATRLTPVAVAGGLEFGGVSAGASGINGHTCGTTTSNQGYCWGSNFVGQLGDGTTTDRLKPVPVAGPM